MENSCAKCKSYGVTCEESRIFNSWLLRIIFGGRTATIDGSKHLINISVNECPVNAEGKDPEQMAQELKNAVKAQVIYTSVSKGQ